MLDETKATEFELILEGLISAVKGFREGTASCRIMLDGIGTVRVISVKERLEFMDARATDAKRFLDEAMKHLSVDEIPQALEKLTVAEILTRELIAETKMDYVRLTEGISLDKALRSSGDRHVMWYELKEKYRHV